MRYVRCKLTQEEVNHYCNCFVLLSSNPSKQGGRLRFFKRKPQGYRVLPPYGTTKAGVENEHSFKVPSLDSPVISLKRKTRLSKTKSEYPKGSKLALSKAHKSSTKVSKQASANSQSWSFNSTTQKATQLISTKSVKLADKLHSPKPDKPATKEDEPNTPVKRNRGRPSKVRQDTIKLVDISLLIKPPGSPPASDRDSTSTDDTSSSPVAKKKTNGVVKTPMVPLVRRPSGRIIKPNMRLLDFVDPEDRKPLVESPKAGNVSKKRKKPDMESPDGRRKRGRVSQKMLRQAESGDAKTESEDDDVGEEEEEDEGKVDESLVVRSFLPTSPSTRDLMNSDEESSTDELEELLSEGDPKVVNGFKSVTVTDTKKKPIDSARNKDKQKSPSKKAMVEDFDSASDSKKSTTNAASTRVTSKIDNILRSPFSKGLPVVTYANKSKTKPSESWKTTVKSPLSSPKSSKGFPTSKLLTTNKVARVTSVAAKAKDTTTLVLVSDQSKPKPDTYSFSKLVKELKSVVLPAPNWRIRIVVSKEQSISEITFTNKQPVERCVKFTKVSVNYKILFGQKTIVLLGAPPVIQAAEDVSILLSIVDKIAENDPIIECIN